MSISIKPDSWYVKDENGQYRGTAIFSSTLPSEAQQIVTESIAEINAVKATIPADYTELSNKVDGLDDDLTDLSADVTDLSNAISQLDDSKAPVIINTASGDIATFSDGADGMPIKHLIANIEPVQAEGTPSPENPLPITGCTGLTVKQNGKNLCKLPPKGTSSTNYGVTFTYNIDGTITINGATTTNSTSQTVSGFRLKPGVYKKPAIVNGVGLVIQKKTLPNWSVVSGGGAASNTFTITEEELQYGLVARVYVYPSAGTLTDYIYYPYIYLSSETDMSFEPYVEKTISVSWESQAGTIYGGTVDVVSGKLVADRAIVTGTWNKSPDYNHIFYRTGIGNKTFSVLVLSDVISNILPTVQANSLSAFDNMDYGIRVTDIVYAVNKDCSTAEEFNAWATQSGLQVVYTLATPVEYQLTPQEVNTLLGNNTVYVDCGSVTVDYPADTKLYVDGLTAPDEDMIADANIASGKYFVVNNQLYLSTAAIAAGASIVPGTNCTATNLAEALNALNT